MPCRASTVEVADTGALLRLLRERLDYDPKRGAFYRKAGFRGVVAGSQIGCPDSAGKLQATFLGVRHQVDRLVWLWETGALPTDALLHVDGDNGNDRFENLKEGRRAPSLDGRREQLLEQLRTRFGAAVTPAPDHEYRGHDTAAAFLCHVHGPFKRKPCKLMASSHGCPACCKEHWLASLVRKTPEQKLERQRAYQRAHPEIYVAANKQSRQRIKETDPERWAESLKTQAIRHRAWGKTKKGREHGRLQRQRRRAREKAPLSVGLTLAQWGAICAAHTNAAGEVCCKYCKQACAPTIDHVVPIARGGRHEPGNVVPACGSCNSSKCARLIHEWPRASQLLSPSEYEHLAQLTREHLAQLVA